MDSSVGNVNGRCFGWKVCPSQTTKISERHCGVQGSESSRLAQLGELLSARQALEGAAVAPGDKKTWKALSDKTKRAKRQRHPLEDELLPMVPPDPLVLDIELMMKTLRSAKKRSAGGPPGMTVEHLRPLLESGVCTALLGEVTQFARGQVPEEVLPAVRLGRMTALQKQHGGVRSVVVGDVFRRLVGRTLAKQFAEQSQAATHPSQYALSTRACRECVAHVVQALTSLDPSATYIWEDEVGDVRHVLQGEKVANKGTP